jgi:biopolymer transport protein ExbD
MADIAFLLLTFFLVTTVIQNHKGILMMLPQFSQNPPDVPIPERNLFTVQINSADRLLVEGKPRETVTGLRVEIEEFILNRGRDKKLSDNPLEAVVSLKTDRGTTYKMFIATLDEIKAAYFEIYAKRVGITAEEFRMLNTNNPREAALYHRAKEGIPMNISMAEPSNSRY